MHVSFRLRSLLLLGSVMSCGGFSGPALAKANAPQSGENDIVVTAERTSGKLQTTPIAITVLSGEQLARQGIDNTRDIAGQVPNLVLPRAGQTPSTQTYFIRGIGELDPHQSSGVGVYVDDVYIPRNIGTVINLVDVSQVEVLRGPQGTLYGRNTAAGAIRVQTRDLTDEPSGLLQIGIGNYDAFQAKAYLSGAIVPDKLRIGVALLHTRRDGYTYDPTIDQHVNDANVDSFRAKLQFLPSDRLDILLSGDYTRDRSTQTYNTPHEQPGGGYDPSLSFSENQPLNRLDSGGGSIRVTWNDGDLTLKSISAIRAFRQVSTFDNDGEALDILRAEADFRYNTFSQEFQAAAAIGPVSLVGGLFYYHEHYDASRQSNTRRYLGTLPVGNHGINDTDSYAAYLQGKYTLAEGLTLTAGLRFTYERQDLNFVQTSQDAAGNDTGIRFVAITNDHWKKLTPKIGIDYRASDTLFLYASITQGFQVGGYDTRPPTLQTALLATRPETVWTYEAGVKTNLLGHRLRLNLAAFYNDYKDLLVWTYDDEIGTAHRINAPKAHNYGLEAEAAVIPLPGIEWSNSFGYLNAKYDRFDNPNGPGTSSAGLKLPYAAKYTLRSALNLTIPLPVPGTFRMGGDYQYQSSVYTEIANLPQSAVPAQNFFNANASYSSKDGHWSVLAEIKNIGNKRYNQVGFYNTTLGVWYGTPNPPRLYTVSLRYAI